MEMIGRYRITGRIGSGSFATVYEGHDDTLDVPVAVKVLADFWATNDEVRQRFLAEARLLRRISDERIVSVYDIGTTDRGQPYFVMDLADGGSFERMREQRVAPGLALRLCAEAARALEVLHRNRLVHRDVTPGNILLTHISGGLRVLLAGLRTARDIEDDHVEQSSGLTPAYLAPEQASGLGNDPRSDFYSMACVVYAVLSGQPPFPVKTLAELTARTSSVTPPRIPARLGGSDALHRLLVDCLSLDLDRRPQTALLLANALDRLASGLPGADQYSPRPLAAPESQPTPTPVVVPPKAVTPPSPASPARVESPLPAGRARSPRIHLWWTASAAVLLLLTIALTIYVVVI